MPTSPGPLRPGEHARSAGAKSEKQNPTPGNGVSRGWVFVGWRAQIGPDEPSPGPRASPARWPDVVSSVKSLVRAPFWSALSCRVAPPSVAPWAALVPGPNDLPYFPSPWWRTGVWWTAPRSNHEHACVQTTERPSGSQASGLWVGNRRWPVVPRCRDVGGGSARTPPGSVGSLRWRGRRLGPGGRGDDDFCSGRRFLVHGRPGLVSTRRLPHRTRGRRLAWP